MKASKTEKLLTLVKNRDIWLELPLNVIKRMRKASTANDEGSLDSFAERKFQSDPPESQYLFSPPGKSRKNLRSNKIYI